MDTSKLTAPAYAEPLVGYRSRKAAQLCAWFAVRAGGQIEKLKLIKLIYLTEREHLSTFDDSMLLDELYSLPNGPICSSTLNGINGVIHTDVWDEFILRNGNIVVAMKAFSREELDDISEEEIGLAEKIWAKFGCMSSSQIRNYTHKNCPEYRELEVGRFPISYRDVLEAVGSENAVQIENEIADLRQAENILSCSE